ncbi:carbohydrate ABC transporter permease [Microbacterium sp. ANT_H45B]|uniref:carbohydrate ABC transporter permease n=1 Tax=unclassified Microbacterium TaxID=2609290 RepID=UPI0009E699ED|nr:MULTISPECIES: carbohydrate ABC transporter permease [unclassified Microbacterium]KAA0960112.1 carbohydrate ABC transporter permease [Microbacterium sp. ANT_H45B]
MTLLNRTPTSTTDTQLLTTLSGRRRSSTRHTLRGIPYHITGIVLALVFLFPLVWSTLNSFKTPAEASSSPPTLWPQQLSGENYEELIANGEGLGQYVGNSLVVAGVSVLLTIVIATLGGYGFARFQFRGKNIVFLAVIAVLMVPHATLVLPLYFMFARAGMQDSLVAVGLVLTVFQLPFSIFLMRNSFEAIPVELEEAGRVDGASSFGVFLRISLPLVLPGVVTVALFAFLVSWNEFFIPLLLLNDGSNFTLSVMLVNIRSGAYGSIDWGLLQAGTTVAILPCLVLYLVLQRFYIGGLTEGALRG